MCWCSILLSIVIPCGTHGSVTQLTLAEKCRSFAVCTLNSPHSCHRELSSIEFAGATSITMWKRWIIERSVFQTFVVVVPFFTHTLVIENCQLLNLPLEEVSWETENLWEKCLQTFAVVGAVWVWNIYDISRIITTHILTKNSLFSIASKCCAFLVSNQIIDSKDYNKKGLLPIAVSVVQLSWFIALSIAIPK